MHTLDWSDLDYLLPKTKQVLVDLSEFDFLASYTFVGGSGLSLYLHHRLSEDIDLFTWAESIDRQTILPALQKKYDQLKIEQSTPRQLDVMINDVKVTFFANHWEALKDRQPFYQNLQVASIHLLTGMKLNTLFLRAKYRDYYDLYCLHKSVFSIQEMYTIIHDLMPGMNKRLFQMAITYTEDIVDDHIQHLQPKYKLSKEQIGTYFQEKVREWLAKL